VSPIFCPKNDFLSGYSIVT